MDPTEHFMRKYKLPKKDLNEVREFNLGKQITEALKSKIDPDKFKCFEEIASKVFSFFEEIAGKKVNRSVMVPNISHYLEEGFEVEDMNAHIRMQISASYYKENPERFTIANLFPIKDQERVNRAWDDLSYHLSMRTKKPNIVASQVFLLRCKHRMNAVEWSQNGYCVECLKAGNLEEIAKNPYAEEVPVLFKEFAEFFKRQEEELPLEYQERTTSEFKKIIRGEWDQISI